MLTEQDIKDLIVKYKSPRPTRFGSVVFPVVRKVFSKMIASEIVSVQPMALPQGLLFWLDYQYGTSGSKDTK